MRVGRGRFKVHGLEFGFEDTYWAEMHMSEIGSKRLKRRLNKFKD